MFRELEYGEDPSDPATMLSEDQIPYNSEEENYSSSSESSECMDDKITITITQCQTQHAPYHHCLDKRATYNKIRRDSLVMRYWQMEFNTYLYLKPTKKGTIATFQGEKMILRSSDTYKPMYATLSRSECKSKGRREFVVQKMSEDEKFVMRYLIRKDRNLFSIVDLDIKAHKDVCGYIPPKM